MELPRNGSGRHLCLCDKSEHGVSVYAAGHHICQDDIGNLEDCSKNFRDRSIE